jgi:hypothetical protein
MAAPTMIMVPCEVEPKATILIVANVGPNSVAGVASKHAFT